MNRLDLLQALDNYNTSFKEEAFYIPRFKSLVTNFTNCYSRSLLSGHLTASAWIINETGTSALLIHHKKLNRWLQPGGHADGEEDVLSVASKEASEETGLISLQIYNNLIFDIDIHLIPAYQGINAHFHYDVRFLFIADELEKHAINHESNEIAWVPLGSLSEFSGSNQSIQRMVYKTESIFK